MPDRRAVSAAVLEGAARRFGAAVDDLEPLGGFHNRAFGFRRDGRAHVLRLTPPEHRTPDLVHAEVDWVRYLHDGGASVAPPVPAADGALFAAIPDPGGTGPWTAAAFGRAPGRFREAEDWNDGLFEAMGGLVGRLHALTRAYEPPSPTVRRREWWQEEATLDGRVVLPADQQDVVAARAAVLAHLHGLPAPPDAFGLVHTDVQVGNLRIDGARLTLFDFDDCDYEWFASDIAISLFYALQDPLTTGHPATFARRFLGRFLNGYDREHRLDRSWLREMPWFLKQRELALYIALWQAFGGGPMPPWPRRFMSGRLARIRSGAPVVDLDFASL